MNLFHGLYRKLKKHEFVSSVAILVSGTVLSQAVIVALTPLLTRMYTPEDFGVLSVYLSLMFTVAIITSLHYETAIPLPEEEKDALNLLVLSFLILFVNVLLAVIILVFFAKPLTALFKTEGLSEMIGFLPLSILGFGLFQVCQLWLLRREDYSQITKGKVRMNLSQIFSQAGLGLMGGPGGLIAGEVIGRIAGGGRMAFSVWKVIKQKWSLISVQSMWKMAVRYRRFPLVSSWSSLLNGLTQHLPALFIAYALGVKAAGWYLIANRILALPDALLGYSVKQVYIAKSAKVIHCSLPAFAALFWNTVKKMTLISLAVYLPIALLAPFAFPFVFGEGWGIAGTFVQCMSLLFFCQLAAGPVSATFTLLEEQYIQVLCEFARLIMLAAGMLIAHLYLEKAWQVVLCLSIAGALGFALLGYFSWYVLIRRQRKKESVGGVHDGYIARKS